MSDYEKNFLVFLVPFLFFTGIHEIKRGYEIIKHNIYTTTLAEKIRNKMLGQVSEEPEGKGLHELSAEQKLSGYYSIFYGVISLIGIIILIGYAIVT